MDLWIHVSLETRRPEILAAQAAGPHVKITDSDIKQRNAAL